MDIEKIDKQIRAYIGKLDPAVSGQHGHDTTFHVACVLVQGFGLSPEDAWPFAAEYNARCKPPWSERDLRRKLDQALAGPNDRPRGYLLGRSLPNPPGTAPQPILSPPKPTYRPEKLASVASRAADDIKPEYLEARSKFTCWNRSPAGALHKLYRKGERVIVFTASQSQGAEVWEHPGLAGNLATLDHLTHGCEQGVWFLAQPVTGEFVELDRLKTDHNPTGRSRRCEECVTSWRYAVVESDKVPAEQWLKALVQLPLRISAIYTSGGKSVHALARIDADSKADWDSVVRGEMSPILVPLGADPWRVDRGTADQVA